MLTAVCVCEVEDVQQQLEQLRDITEMMAKEIADQKLEIADLKHGSITS